MKEIWKDIPCYVGLYQASDLGRIKSFHRCKELNKNIILEICKLITNNIKQCNIALKFNISRANISRIKNNPHKYLNREKFLNQYIDKGGRCIVNLYKNRIIKNCKVHRLVLETFVGPCPFGMECRHLDGNQKNNRVDNLRWGTHIENVGDTIIHGTQYHPKYDGENYPNAKTNRNKVIEIKKLLEEGKLNITEISKLLDISRYIVQDIKRKRTWRNINE